MTHSPLGPKRIGLFSWAEISWTEAVTRVGEVHKWDPRGHLCFHSEPHVAVEDASLRARGLSDQIPHPAGATVSSCAAGAPAFGGAFRAERSRWWEQKTCFIGVWIAEFTAMEAITQYFVCRVQRQQTSQGLGLFWLGLLVPLTWGSAGETAFLVNACCWAEDWPLWPLCSEILPIPVLGPQDGQKSRASGHGWLKGVEERDLFVLGMGKCFEKIVP